MPLTQLIAHDKEVFDIAFQGWLREVGVMSRVFMAGSQGPDKFASVGADGSLRMFDLRSLEHSTILFETAHSQPLLRICWNKLVRREKIVFRFGCVFIFLTRIAIISQRFAWKLQKQL